MPIYEFRCISCEYESSDFFHMNEVKPDICPKCMQKTFKQRVSMPSSWHPHPIVFQKSPARQQAVAKQADLMVKNNEDK